VLQLHCTALLPFKWCLHLQELLVIQLLLLLNQMLLLLLDQLLLVLLNHVLLLLLLLQQLYFRLSAAAAAELGCWLLHPPTHLLLGTIAAALAGLGLPSLS